MNDARIFFAPEADAGGGNGNGGSTATATAPERSLIPADAGKTTAAATTTTDGKGVVAETWWKGWMKEDGTLNPERLNHLPDDLKGSQAILARFRKADDFFKSFAHGQTLISQKGLTPLRADATPEERTEHMKRLALVTGAPDKPEGYGIKNENADIQKQYDEFAKVFHKWALPPDAVKELVALNETLQKQQLEQFEEQQAREEDARWQEQEKLIAREFGAFKQEKFAAARSGARWMGIDPDSPMFKQNALLIVAAAKVGEKISDARHIDGGSSASFDADPEVEMAALVNDASHKYYDILRNPSKNARLFAEASEYQRKLGERIAAKRARQGAGAR